MGFLGNEIGGKPTFGLTDVVKNQPIQDQINASIVDYSRIKGLGDTSLKNYLSKYAAGTPEATRNTGQEIDAISGYYNGDVARALAGLSAQRHGAVLDAASLAGQNALRASNLSLLNGGGGASSYNSRILSRNMADIGANAALDNANQLSQNYQQVLGGQIANAGRRTSLADALAMRSMMPYTASSGVYGNNLGYLNNLTSLNNANNIFGTQQNSRGDVADFFDNADQGISNVFGMIGAAYAGGKTPQIGNSQPGGGIGPTQSGGSGFQPVQLAPWDGGNNYSSPMYLPQQYQTPSYYGDGPSTMYGGWGAPSMSPASVQPDVGWGGGSGGGYDDEPSGKGGGAGALLSLLA